MIIVQDTIRHHRRAIAVDFAPVVRGLQAPIEAIVQTQLRRFQSSLRALTPDQLEAIEISLRAMANEILDPVFRSLKRAAQQGDSETIARMCALFDLPSLRLLQLREDGSSSFASHQPDLMIA
jgi:glutamyl-tRNA reductase